MPTLNKLITTNCVDAFLLEYYNISSNHSNDFTFDLELLNITARKICILPKVSTNGSGSKIVPIKMK